jgi:hypothetical protein
VEYTVIMRSTVVTVARELLNFVATDVERTNVSQT